MSKEEQIKKYLVDTVNPILKPMVAKIVKERPQNIMKCILEYAKKYLEQFRQKEIVVHPSNHSIESVINKQEADQLQKLFQKKKKKKQRTQSANVRKGISAEVFGDFNKKPQFTPKNFQKHSEEVQFLQKNLPKSFIFQNLSEENLKIVIQAMQHQKYNPEMQIIKEGDNGDMLYIIRSGEYLCTKIINGKPKQLRIYKEGEIFGQLSLMYNTKRAASIKCTKEGTIYALDRLTFTNIVQQKAIKTREEYMKIISKIQILSEIHNAEKDVLCDALKEEKFEANQYVVNEGENGDRLYFIIEGNLIADKFNPKTNKKEIVFKYKENEYFGEIALVKNTVRQASVKAVTKCRLLSVGRDEFKRLLGPIEKILQRNIQKYKKFITPT